MRNSIYRTVIIIFESFYLRIKFLTCEIPFKFLLCCLCITMRNVLDITSGLFAFTLFGSGRFCIFTGTYRKYSEDLELFAALANASAAEELLFS